MLSIKQLNCLALCFFFNQSSMRGTACNNKSKNNKISLRQSFHCLHYFRSLDVVGMNMAFTNLFDTVEISDRLVTTIVGAFLLNPLATLAWSL